MDLRNALITLFTETFEGIQPGEDGTYYVQGREALFPLLASITAHQASARPNEAVSSIAAHVHHMTYYIHLLNEEFAGGEPNIDWDESWAVQKVSQAEWDRERQDLKEEYVAMRDNLATCQADGEDEDVFVLAQLAHAAFHLGSIRQLAMMQGVQVQD